MPESGQAFVLWWLALAAAAVVLLVVIALLTLIVGAVSAISGEASAIRVGADNIHTRTVQLLRALTTNAVVQQIVGGAGLILAQAGRVAGHVQSCPGCPACTRGPAPVSGAAAAPAPPPPPPPPSTPSFVPTGWTPPPPPAWRRSS